MSDFCISMDFLTDFMEGVRDFRVVCDPSVGFDVLSLAPLLGIDVSPCFPLQFRHAVLVSLQLVLLLL